MKILAHLPHGSFIGEHVELARAILEKNGSIGLVQFEDMRQILERVSQLGPGDIYMGMLVDMAVGGVWHFDNAKHVLGEFSTRLPRHAGALIFDTVLLDSERDEINTILAGQGTHVFVFSAFVDDLEEILNDMRAKLETVQE